MLNYLTAAFLFVFWNLVGSKYVLLKCLTPITYVYEHMLAWYNVIQEIVPLKHVESLQGLHLLSIKPIHSDTV